MTLNDVPILPPVENSSFDHLAFYNSIMNDTTLGLSLEPTTNVSPTLLPDSDFMFADNDPLVNIPPRGSAAAVHSNTASLAAFLEPCKAYQILTEQEYQDRTRNKQFLSQKLAGLEAELECEIEKKVNLSTSTPTVSMVTSVGKDDHHHRKPLFSRKLKFKTQANDNTTVVTNNTSSHEIAEVNQRIQKLNTEILELVREVKDQELQLLQHQAAVLAAAYEQTQRAAQLRPQSTTAKATTRMKNYSAQPAESAQEENDKAVIDGLIASFKECIQVISGILPVPASVETPDQQQLSDGTNPKFMSSNGQAKNSCVNSKMSSAATPAMPTGDTVASKLRTLFDITQQVTLELSQLRTRAITAEKTSVAEIAQALGAAEQTKKGLQRQHLQEIQQLKQAQLVEIEHVQAAFDALSAARVPAEQPLSVNILQREFKAMMREKMGSAVATNGVA